jgi:hypothetical protein
MPPDHSPTTDLAPGFIGSGGVSSFMATAITPFFHP